MQSSLIDNCASEAASGDWPGDTATCFHCELPIPLGFDVRVLIDGVAQPMCCHGCAAVAEAIVDAGQAQFYRVRTESQTTAPELLPEKLRETEIYDSDAVQAQLVRSLDANQCEASLMLDGVTCAACLWLIENRLAALPGVSKASVNYATQRASVRWRQDRIRLSDILQAIRKIGYRAVPYDPSHYQLEQRRQRRLQQRRLAIAGLFGMQVMMLAIALYAGAWSGIERSFEQAFRWLSLGLALPVLVYAGFPFYRSAWRELRHGRVKHGRAGIAGGWHRLRQQRLCHDDRQRRNLLRLGGDVYFLLVGEPLFRVDGAPTQPNSGGERYAVVAADGNPIERRFGDADIGR